MAQFLVIHTWPDKSASVMQDVLTSEVAANIHAEQCNAIKHDRVGHSYRVVVVSALLHVTKAAPRREPDDRPRVYSDEEISALARA